MLESKFYKERQGKTSFGRLTVVETVYHALDNRQPTCAESNFSHILSTDEQPYVRRSKVGKERQQLDKGWLIEHSCSHLVLSNDTGKNLQVIPSAPEKKMLESRVLQLWADDSPSLTLICQIPPGQSVRLPLPNMTSLSICCPIGEAEITIYLFPA